MKLIENIITILEQAKRFGAIDFINDVGKRVWEYFQKDYDLGYSDEHPDVIAKVLHRMNTGTAPKIALVGMTSAGKSSLINALFGKSISEVQRTADTTSCVLVAEFPSGLLIYDTPGLAGDEQLGYENITRLFLEIPQEEDATQFSAVPFQEKPPEIIDLSTDQLPKLDAILFLVDISRTLNKYQNKALRGFFLELKNRFGDHIVIAGTHLDELNKLSDQERQVQLESYNKIFDNHLAAVSSVSGEGLSELIIKLFCIMPQKVPPAKLQESLISARKLNRFSFVIKESSNLLAEIILLKGNQVNDIKAAYLWLFALICKHDSVDENTWLSCNGDALKIADKAIEAGRKQYKTTRPPEDLLEKLQAFLGKSFQTSVIETKPLGIDGLQELLPGVYELLYVLINVTNPKYNVLKIDKLLSLKASEIEKFAQQNNIEKLAYQIGEILQQLFEEDSTDFHTQSKQTEQIGLRVLVHMEEIKDEVFRNGEFAGTSNAYRRLEGFQLNIDPPIPGLSIKYMAHLQEKCDVPWVSEGEFIGTRGEWRRLEGFAIELTGVAAKSHNIFYRCRMQGIGDSRIYSNGQFCGSRGQSRAIEGIQVWLEQK
ncbi:MAG: 50S ribosome-binding GTPase [Calothrix sp. FI2-JRJ7]|jgi:GTPase Era involved in 16S rRNA processing|nr:50S ribosome-binding GTPase [Calothrix sp. FI2-JRJ7]